jgi:hypothetical protein
MHHNATESGVDILDKLAREYTCMRSIRHWPLQVFFNLIDAASINEFVLGTLKYPNWRQKKNNQRHLYLSSLGEEMVTPHIRRRTDSENVNRHTRRAMSGIGVACKQPASSATVQTGGGRQRGRCSICTTATDRKTDG